MAELILIRHGESVWNSRNLFTGWVDVPLSEKGVKDAIEAGKQIALKKIDCAYTSGLIRAQHTLALALLHHHSGKTPVFLHEGKLGEWGKIYSQTTLEEIIPVNIAWQLNERMYGALQGLNKAETAEKFGKEQVQKWRRSFDTAPPEGESLKTCSERTLPYFNTEIVPQLKRGKNVLIVAHGNSLRSIIMELEALSPDEVVSLELSLGEPLYYEYRDGSFFKCS